MFSRVDAEIRGIGENGEEDLPNDPPGQLEVVEGIPDGGKIHELVGEPSAFTPDYAPEEMFEIATSSTRSRADHHLRGGTARPPPFIGAGRI